MAELMEIIDQGQNGFTIIIHTNISFFHSNRAVCKPSHGLSSSAAISLLSLLVLTISTVSSHIRWHGMAAKLPKKTANYLRDSTTG